MLSKFLSWLRPEDNTNTKDKLNAQKKTILAEEKSILPKSRQSEKTHSKAQGTEPTQITSARLIEKLESTISYHERTRHQLQRQFDNASQGQTLKLMPQEYPGPLFIRKPLIIDGQGATLWALRGAVLHIDSPHVTLKNLNIEVTGESFIKSEDECAIYIKNPTSVFFENVQVRGQIIGIQGETGAWQYPHSLHLGKLAQNKAHQFVFQLSVPTQCRLESAIYGVQLTPTILDPGIKEIRINVEPLYHGTSLHGSLYIRTAQLKRRIYLTAYISSEVNSVTQQAPRLIWSLPPIPITEKKQRKLGTTTPLKPKLSSDNKPQLPPHFTSQEKRKSQKTWQPPAPTAPADPNTHLKHLKNSIFYAGTRKVSIEEENASNNKNNDNIFLKQNKNE
jgi:hypothetical protein